MKKIFYSLPLIFLLIPQLGQAEFVEGTHFLMSPNPQPVETGEKIEVREFFWYGCSHCYALEPDINRWLKRLPKSASLVRTPGAASRWLVHAQAYYAFESMGAVDKVHGAFFDALHREQRSLNDEDSITRFVAQHGLDPAQFRQAFNSFGVRLKLERAKKLNVAFRVHSVPTLIVDGKYITSPAMAGGGEATMQVIDFLIKKSVAERKKTSAGR